MTEPTKVEGIDYSIEGIKGLRLDLITMHDYYASAGPGPWTEQLVYLNHAIAVLAYMIEREELINSAVEAIREVPFQPFPVPELPAEPFVMEKPPGSTECKMGGQPHLGQCSINDFCHIHGRHERDLPEDFQACGECLHVWRTVEEFGVDVMRARGEDKARTPAELADENVCPLCTHDF